MEVLLKLEKAQLIQFNAAKRKRHNTALTTRHSKLTELPDSIGLSIHTNTKKNAIAKYLDSIVLNIS